MKKIIAFLAAASLVYACGNNSDHIEGYEYTETGLGYKFHRQNDTGKLAEFGSGVYGFIQVRTLDGKLIFNIADSTGGQPIPFKVEDYKDTADLFEGISTMREGDSATFVIKASTYYEAANDYPEGIKAEDKLLVDVSLVKVFTPQDLEMEALKQNQLSNQEYIDSVRATLWEPEIQAMNDYFEKEGIMTHQTLDVGVKVAVTKKGEGAKAEKGDEVKADFAFFVLSNGASVISTVEAGEPFVFKSIGDIKYGEIPGIHDAILAMKEGDEAIVAIPFDRAFGEQQMSEKIPPFSTLVGTIKILSVKKK